MSWFGRYIGLPFVSGGRGPDKVDCWGLVVVAYREVLGIDLPLYGDISADETIRLCRAIDRGKDGAEWQRVEVPQPLDVAVLRLPASLRVGHVGIVADHRHILHVEQATNVALERMDSVKIKNRIAGFWRHRAA